MRELEPGDPRRLGDHELVGALGTGGFGRVYVARAPHDKWLTVKLAHPHLLRADPGFVGRFGAVMGDLSRVRNLGAGRIVQWDAEDLRPWYARRFVPGASLTELLSTCGALPRAAGRIAGGVARGLAAMHAAELPHGGVAPGNVLVSVTSAQLVDGGLAALFTRAPEAIRARFPLTGGAFAPPEGGAETMAADLYALGVLVVLCARGTLPHGPQDVAELPDGLAALARALMDPVPAARPRAAEVAAWMGATGSERVAGETGLPGRPAIGAAGRSAGGLAADAANGHGKGSRRRVADQGRQLGSLLPREAREAISRHTRTVGRTAPSGLPTRLGRLGRSGRSAADRIAVDAVADPAKNTAPGASTAATTAVDAPPRALSGTTSGAAIDAPPSPTAPNPTAPTATSSAAGGAAAPAETAVRRHASVPNARQGSDALAVQASSRARRSGDGPAGADRAPRSPGPPRAAADADAERTGARHGSPGSAVAGTGGTGARAGVAQDGADQTSARHGSPGSAVAGTGGAGAPAGTVPGTHGTSAVTSGAAAPRISNDPGFQARGVWVHRIQGIQNLFSADGLLFADGDSLTALDARSGDSVWTKPGWRMAGEPRGGRAYLAQGTRIALVDAATGAEVWRTDIAAARGLWARSAGRLARSERAFRVHAVYEPVSDVVIAIGGHSELFGLDPATGALLWNRREARRTAFSRNDAGAIFLSGDGREPVRALDPRTGELLWADDAEDSIVTAVDRGWVLCARFRRGTAEIGEYVVRAADTGDLVHRDLNPGDTALLDEGLLYVLGGARMRAVCPSTGKELWNVEWTGGGAGIAFAPSAGGAYLRGDDRRVYAVDLADGACRWVSGPIPAQAPLDPVGGQLDRTLPVLAAGDVVCVRSHSDAVLIVLDRADGRERWWWRSAFGTLTMVAPVVAEELVCVVDGDRVRALTGRQ